MHEPIGTLFNNGSNGRISPRDLVYAVENAWEGEVREAARTLLAH